MKRYHDDTERRPCGMPDRLRREFTRTAVDLGDCLVAPRGPRSITIWEPLDTKAPGPNLVRPYCCYIAHVVFYAFPFRLRGRYGWRSNGRWYCEREPGRVFVEWDAIDTRLTWGDLVLFDGEIYEVHGGTVRWESYRREAHRWWMCRFARLQEDSNGHG